MEGAAALTTCSTMAADGRPDGGCQGFQEKKLGLKMMTWNTLIGSHACARINATWNVLIGMI